MKLEYVFIVLRWDSLLKYQISH